MPSSKSQMCTGCQLNTLFSYVLFLFMVLLALKNIKYERNEGGGDVGKWRHI